MNKERLRLAIRLGVGVVVIAAVCAIAIFGLRACSRMDPEPTVSEPSESTPGTTGDTSSQSTDPPTDDALSDYADCEDNSTWGEDLVGACHNETVLTYNYGRGTISLGVNAPEAKDAIYLNPVCSEAAAEKGRQIGFFITAGSSDLYFSRTEGAAPDTGENAKSANFVLLGETYDTAVPAAYVDQENFGVCWKRDPLSATEDGDNTTLYIRAVNLSSGQLIAMCRATITHDTATDSYSLTSLTSSDVVDTGEMTAEEKASLAEQAVQFMVAQNIVMPPNGWSDAQAAAMVEHVPTTYFPWFIGPNNEHLKSYEKPYQNCEIWAVNLPLTTGTITVYFAPYLQAVLGFESATMPGSDELNLVPIGCARLNPFSEDTISG